MLLSKLCSWHHSRVATLPAPVGFHRCFRSGQHAGGNTLKCQSCPPLAADPHQRFAITDCRPLTSRTPAKPAGTHAPGTPTSHSLAILGFPACLQEPLILCLGAIQHRYATVTADAMHLPPDMVCLCQKWLDLQTQKHVKLQGLLTIALPWPACQHHRHSTCTSSLPANPCVGSKILVVWCRC